MKFISKLASGAFGTVNQMYHLKAKKNIALKECSIRVDERFLKQAYLEICTQAKCDCRFIVKLYGSYTIGEIFYMPIEYMNLGSLKSALKQVGTFSEGILGCIIFQVRRFLLNFRY